MYQDEEFFKNIMKYVTKAFSFFTKWTFLILLNKMYRFTCILSKKFVQWRLFSGDFCSLKTWKSHLWFAPPPPPPKKKCRQFINVMYKLPKVFQSKAAFLSNYRIVIAPCALHYLFVLDTEFLRMFFLPQKLKKNTNWNSKFSEILQSKVGNVFK